MASIEQLKSVVSRSGGIARNNLFTMVLPSISGVSINPEELNVLCRDVQLPGRQILSNERRIGMQLEKVAYGYAVTDVSATFLCLNDYGVKDYFEAWQNITLNQDTYEVAYKNEYAAPIKIYQLAKNKLTRSVNLYNTNILDILNVGLNLNFRTDVVYGCELIDAYPTTINALQLNNELDGVLELNVQFSYKNWRRII